VQGADVGTVGVAEEEEGDLPLGLLPEVVDPSVLVGEGEVRLGARRGDEDAAKATLSPFRRRRRIRAGTGGREGEERDADQAVAKGVHAD
jgi:hypothetical protein